MSIQIQIDDLRKERKVLGNADEDEYDDDDDYKGKEKDEEKHQKESRASPNRILRKPSLIKRTFTPLKDEYEESLISESESVKNHFENANKFLYNSLDERIKPGTLKYTLTRLIKGRPKPWILHRLYAYFTMTVILVSIIFYILENTYIPQFKIDWQVYLDEQGNHFESSLWPAHTIPWFCMESLFLLFFMFDFFARLVINPDKWKFIKSPLNVLDFLALCSNLIFPVPSTFVLKKILNPLRILRILRILYLSNMLQHSLGLIVTYRAIVRSLDALFLYLLFIFLILLTSSSFMFYVERGDWNAITGSWEREINGVKVESRFQSITDGFWWGMVTLATVGYGDLVPETGIGKALAGLTMIFSILIIALPTSILGSNFMAEWQLHQRMEFKKKLNPNGSANEIAVAWRKFRNPGNAHPKGSLYSIVANDADQQASETASIYKGNQRTANVINDGPARAVEMPGPTCIRCLRYECSPATSKMAKIKALTDHNEAMLDLIGNLQEMLADVNPPEYYRRYKKVKSKYQAAVKRISDLEDMLAQQEKQTQTMQHLISSYEKLMSSGSARYSGPFRKKPDFSQSQYSIGNGGPFDYLHGKRNQMTLVEEVEGMDDFSSTNSNHNLLSSSNQKSTSGIGVIPEVLLSADEKSLPYHKAEEIGNGSNANSRKSSPSKSITTSNAFIFTRKTSAFPLTRPGPGTIIDPTSNVNTSSSHVFKMIPLDERISTMPSYGVSEESRPRRSWRSFLKRSSRK